jgi:hypothetical protein
MRQIMAKKLSPNELHWKAKTETIIKNEYKEFLTEKNLENNPESAHQFASVKIPWGQDYLGFKERDFILLLCGNLPYMYD